jgi:hypothetical protein
MSAVNLEEVVMKRLFFVYTLGLMCLFLAESSSAQQGSSVPAEVCAAIEQYVAQINSTAAITVKADREAQYASALKTLTEVLTKHKQDTIIAKAAELADYSEQAAACDPSDPKFGGILEKRLQSRAWLQNVCMPYTTAR